MNIYLKKSFDSKSTQCNDNDLSNDKKKLFKNISSVIEDISADLSPAILSQDKNTIDELKLNLKIKENLIASISDSLVLKEAEIARLKTRIGLMERKSIINEMNENESN